ncbi:hypothetical protein L208DRAFT_1414191, partial [Tricholoma matsutake]
SNSMFRFGLLAIVSTFIISANAAPVPGNSLQFNSVSDIVEREVKKSISLFMKRGNVFGKLTTDEESQPLTSPEDDEPEGRNKRVKKEKPKGNKLKKSDPNSYSQLPDH